MVDKEGLVPEKISEDLNFSRQPLEGKIIGTQSSLSLLKHLSLNTLFEGLGWDKIVMEPVLETSFDSIQNVSLRNLGFVSPPKASPVVRKGYFLRSVSKSFIDGMDQTVILLGFPLIRVGLGHWLKLIIL